MSSISVADLAAYKDYAEKNSAEFLSTIHYAADEMDSFTGHADVLGRVNLTELTVGDLGKRYNENFNPTPNALGAKPRHLDVQDAKMDLRLIPKRWERQFKAYIMRAKRDPSQWPLIGWYINKKILPKIMEELSDALWKGEAAAVPAETDLLVAIVDGLHKILADEISGGNLVQTPTGAFTNTNAVSNLELCYQEMGVAYQKKPLDIYLGVKVYNSVLIDYRERYGKYTRDEHGNPQLDIGTGMDRFHKCASMKDNAILITPGENIHHGYAASDDLSAIQMEKQDRSLKMWMDWKLGYNFGIVNNDIIVTNEYN